MIYHVRARLNDATAKALLERLEDGTIARQKPDGAEIVASMERATVNEDGLVEWSEMCLCPSPLLHERATVLDAHFHDLTTQPIEAFETYPGRPFMERLRELAGRGSHATGQAG